ncbi:MFS transporter [Ectopseudomonas alcaliphila]|uniref:MFS transporter n=1 Tax=Ectopseudomonas alcaliphila TaxID=101564 RepID=UPI002788AF3E|nr:MULTISPECIES: MFS transporter [Pseudomonas]MDP9940512.1 putative MFS family arabinose efflux permease [Pseudomonas sp. 3400]MDR7011923.1 putative MFS family arabinose efflux permease [Pseudomonas alcaliphila]
MRLNAAIVVLLTSLVAASYGFGIYLFAQLVPDMQASLGFGFSFVGAVTASAQFGFLVCAMLAVWLTPRVGGGNVIVASGAVCALALLLMPLSNNIAVLGMLLVVLAGTAATVFVPMVDVISKVVAYRYRGLAMGLVSSGTSYGVAINSLLVPIYAPQGEWRSVWWVVGLLTLVMAVAVLLVFKRAGLLSWSVAPAPTGSLGEIALPSLRSELIRPWVLLVWSMNLLIGFSTFPFQTYLSSYLRTELGFDVQYTAQVWAVIGFVGMFAGLAIGWLSDLVGLRAAMIFVYCCVVIAALIFVVQPSGHWPLVAAVLFSTAFYPIFGLIPAYVSKLASSSAMAISVFGIANVMQGSGGILGNYGAGLLANHSGSFAGVYTVISVVGVLLIVLTLKLPREAPEPAAGMTIRG